jgi:hypothetical protein
VLCGDGDLVQVARGLHRRMLGDEQPFVLCDPGRRDTNARALLENHKTAFARVAADASSEYAPTRSAQRAFTSTDVEKPAIAA